MALSKIETGSLDTTLDLSGKTVTLPSGTGGKVLQTAHTRGGYASSGSTSYAAGGASTGLTVQSSTSKIIVVAQFGVQMDSDSATRGIVQIRHSVDSYTGHLAHISAMDGGASSWSMYPSVLTAEHDHNQSVGTTITYKMYFARIAGSSSFYLADIWDGTSQPTGMILMEVEQ